MDAAASENFNALAVVIRDKNGSEAPKEGRIKLMWMLQCLKTLLLWQW